MANFYLAFEADLHIIPVLNKIDLATSGLFLTFTVRALLILLSELRKCIAELTEIGFDESEILLVCPPTETPLK